jgi:hypothetical protein
MSKVVYTTAPEAYDYSYAETQESFELESFGRVEQWRKVLLKTDAYRVDYQCGRYGSGLHAVREDDPRQDPWRKYGIL